MAAKIEELCSHMETVHREGDYQCDECDFVAVNREKLNSHVQAVHREGDY